MVMVALLSPRLAAGDQARRVDEAPGAALPPFTKLTTAPNRVAGAGPTACCGYL